jgi:Zn finger protein HypA/HybF involved in hydrogenase expression
MNPRTPLSSCPIPKCQIKAVANGLHDEGTERRSTSEVPSRNIMDVYSILNLVVDREVEVSVDTHAEPEPRLEEGSTFFQEIEEKQFKCLCCSEIFTEGNYVKKHIDDVHLDLRPFRCPACECRFSTKGGLNNHIRDIEGYRVSIIQTIACMTSNRNFFPDASAMGSSVQERIPNRQCLWSGNLALVLGASHLKKTTALSLLQNTNHYPGKA